MEIASGKYQVVLLYLQQNEEQYLLDFRVSIGSVERKFSNNG